MTYTKILLGILVVAGLLLAMSPMAFGCDGSGGGSTHCAPPQDPPYCAPGSNVHGQDNPPGGLVCIQHTPDTPAEPPLPPHNPNA